MVEEILVLGRNERLDDQRRDLVVGQIDAAFAGEGLDWSAVVTANVGRQRRLIGQQLLRRRQAGREIEPDRGEQGEHSEAAPGDEADPSPPPPRTQALAHPLVEGDEIGELPVGNVQTLELHSEAASSPFDWRRKAG